MKNNNNRNKKPLNTNLITIIISAVALAVLIALIVPTYITIYDQNAEIENFNKQIEALKDQIAGLDSTDGITAEELEEALGNLDIPEGGLTEDQVKDIINAAIGGLVMPDSGLSEEEIRNIITEALKGIDTGLTEEQVKNIITEALKDVDTGLTEEQVKDIITDALENIDQGLSEEEVKDIIDEVLKDVNTGLTEEEIKNVIDEVLGKRTSVIKAALEAGGEHVLTGNITLEDLNISRNITLNLDLNGYTLTIKGNWQVYGNLTINNGKIVINKPEDEIDLYTHSGICIGDGRIREGSVCLEDVNIIGKRLWNVDNYANFILKNSKLIVEDGYGVSNRGVTLIDNCELIANGKATIQVYGIGGTMNIKNTKLLEGTYFESYYYYSPIESYSGCEITLDNVIVETGEGENGAFIGYDGKIILKSGSIDNKILCEGEINSFTIYGGTVNGVAFEDITENSDIFEGAYFKLIKGNNCWIISR